MGTLIHLSPRDFEVTFKDHLSDFVKKRIKHFNFLAKKVSLKERDEILLNIIDTLNNQIIKAGARRHKQWEKGWAENLRSKSLIPRYFGKFNIVRWRQEFLKPVSKNFELNMLEVIQYWLFDKYLKSAKNIYEFGCGTGHNLLRVREVNKTANIWGLDWAKSSQEIIKRISKERNDDKLFGINFDLFKPDKSFRIDKNSAVFSVAALEQLGVNFEPFLKYLIAQKPKICFHIEPIAELLDEKNLVDYLSILYFRKRNYLNGFLVKLQQLEKIGKIKIHKAQRTFIGSLYIEGYSVIAWSPIK